MTNPKASQVADSVVEQEPDMSWFDIAVTHAKEVVILGNSPGWDDFDIEHWWEDTFSTEAPDLAPGAYRWAGFTVGHWQEDEHIKGTGGTFSPIPRPIEDDTGLMRELVEALEEIEQDIRCAAGCGDDISEGQIDSYVMSWGGSPMAVGYQRVRTALSKAKDTPPG